MHMAQIVYRQEVLFIEFKNIFSERDLGAYMELQIRGKSAKQEQCQKLQTQSKLYQKLKPIRKVGGYIRCDTSTEVLQKLQLALRHLGLCFQRKVLAVQNGGKDFDDILLTDWSTLVFQI